MTDFEITYHKPAKRPVKEVRFTGSLATSFIAQFDHGSEPLVAMGGDVDDPCSLFFDADAAREAAKFFERLATIIDNGGYEIE